MFDRDLFGDDIQPEQHGSILALTWDYPPFSVLNARDGWWQERKRQWLSLGIKSELGRGGAATWNIGTTYDGPNMGELPSSDGTRAELLQESR